MTDKNENKIEEKKVVPVDGCDKDAYLRFLCEGLAGKGCGTDIRHISKYRKTLSWEERRQHFLSNAGD